VKVAILKVCLLQSIFYNINVCCGSEVFCKVESNKYLISNKTTLDRLCVIIS